MPNSKRLPRYVIGQYVRIVDRYTDHIGWHDEWVPGMDAMIGKVVKIIDIYLPQDGFHIISYAVEGSSFNFPEGALEFAPAPAIEAATEPSTTQEFKQQIEESIEKLRQMAIQRNEKVILFFPCWHAVKIDPEKSLDWEDA